MRIGIFSWFQVPPNSSNASAQLIFEVSTVTSAATRIAVPEAPRVFQEKVAVTVLPAPVTIASCTPGIGKVRVAAPSGPLAAKSGLRAVDHSRMVTER